MESKWSQKAVFFLVQKSYEFIAKHILRHQSRPSHYCLKCRFCSFSQKTSFFETHRFASTGTPFLRFIGSFLHDFCIFFYTFFGFQFCMQNMTMCSFTCKIKIFCFIPCASLSWEKHEKSFIMRPKLTHNTT